MANPEKDPRLYFKVPNDFHRHPKVKRLSDAAFRAFVEMIGEARIEDNDGVFAADDAEFLWDVSVLDELVRSHPARPLVLREGNAYVNREYAKHQQTRAEREDAARIARENGAKGGRPRKPRGKPEETQGVSVGNPGGKLTKPNVTQTKPESESESELEIQDLTSSESQSVSQESIARKILTDAEESPEQVGASQRLAKGIGVDLEKVIERADGIDRSLTHGQALMLSTIILAKSKRQPPGNPMAYIATTFKNSPFEVQQWIDREVTA